MTNVPSFGAVSITRRMQKTPIRCGYPNFKKDFANAQILLHPTKALKKKSFWSLAVVRLQDGGHLLGCARSGERPAQEPGRTGSSKNDVPARRHPDAQLLDEERSGLPPHRRTPASRHWQLRSDRNPMGRVAAGSEGFGAFVLRRGANGDPWTAASPGKAYSTVL